MLPECAELDALRLSRDWTWVQLANAMRRTSKLRMSPRTLHYVLKQMPDDSRPHDRTLHKIKLFLKDMRPAERRRATRRRKASASASA